MLTKWYIAKISIGKLAQLSLIVAVAIGSLVAPSHGQNNSATLDALFASVASQVPAFGGMFVDEEQGAIFIYLSEQSPAVVAAVEKALRALFGPQLPPQARIQVLQGTYSFLQLMDWHERIQDVLRLPGVVLTDIDDTTNRLTVGVEDLQAKVKVERRLARLGVPREAVIFEQVPPFVFHTNLQDRHRPLVGGLQIEPRDFTTTCTLGFNAIRQGVPGFVYAAHCDGAPGQVFAQRFHQPSATLPADEIGQETADPAFIFRGLDCPGVQCRFSDSAFAQLHPGVSASQGLIAATLPELGSLAWEGETIPIHDKLLRGPVVGMIVVKVGRRTGTTLGRVFRVCFDANVGISGTIFRCQAEATYVAAPGDSGAPVIFVLPPLFVVPRVFLAGLHWGGRADRAEGFMQHGRARGGRWAGNPPPSGISTSVFSPIANIEMELGPLTVCVPESGC